MNNRCTTSGSFLDTSQWNLEIPDIDLDFSDIPELDFSDLEIMETKNQGEEETMGGKSSQRKGADGERELRAILQLHGYSCQRGGSLSFGTVPDVVGLPGIHIECKRVERLNVTDAMEQAIRDSEAMQDGTPALFHRKNRRPWLVTMRLDDWLMLYQESRAKREKTEEKAAGIAEQTDIGGLSKWH